VEHYVTLFDAGFLPQGLALHRSLVRHGGDFTLWILCMDEAAHEVLSRLDLPSVKLLRLRDVESPELVAVKATRTRAEYCWTMTPFSVRAVFAAETSILRVTYVDADFWFRKSPAPLFAELDQAGKAVLITDHAYAPKYDQSATSGQYCVQFVTFSRAGGLEVLEWWAARCLEWCHARFEESKFGDQKYLEQWPGRFPQVHVLTRTDWLLAPWNATRFPYGTAIAFHFHGLRILSGKRVLLYRGYEIPRATRDAVYGPYVDDLADAATRLVQAGHAVIAQGSHPGPFVAVAIVLKKIVQSLARLRPLAVADLRSRRSR
jgi:hypothetical protein